MLAIPDRAKDAVIYLEGITILAILLLPGAWLKARKVLFLGITLWLLAYGCADHLA